MRNMAFLPVFPKFFTLPSPASKGVGDSLKGCGR